MKWTSWFKALLIVSFTFQFLVLLSSQAVAAVEWTPTSSTVALYHLEDYTDSSGHGYHLTPHNNPNFVQAHFNNGLQTASSPAIQGAFFSAGCGTPPDEKCQVASTTLVITFKITDQPGLNEFGIFFKFSHTPDHDPNHIAEEYLMYRDVGGVKKLTAEHNATGFVTDLDHNVDLFDGKFHNAILSYDKDAPSFNLWLDGVLVASTTTVATHFTISWHPVIAIGDNEGLDHGANGIWDEAFIENRAWSQSDVNHYWNNFFTASFIHPFEPWVQSGFGFGDGWQVEGCFTRKDCDPLFTPPFGRRYRHVGFDAGTSTQGAPVHTPVKASAGGVVVFTGILSGGAGGAVVVEHDLDGNLTTMNDRMTTLYLHVNPLVPIGSSVTQRDIIAEVGFISTSRPHLHFGIRAGPFNPSNPNLSLRGALPPEGTIGCQPCFSSHVFGGLPTFPENWIDPDTVLE